MILFATKFIIRLFKIIVIMINNKQNPATIKNPYEKLLISLPIKKAIPKLKRMIQKTRVKSNIERYAIVPAERENFSIISIFNNSIRLKTYSIKLSIIVMFINIKGYFL